MDSYKTDRRIKEARKIRSGKVVRMAIQTCLVFKMNGSLYAVDVAHAGSVDYDAKIQRMPAIPSCLLGVTTIRDEIVPVVDLHKHFNLGPIILLVMLCFVVD